MQPDINQSRASEMQHERLLREKARRDLLTFSKYVWPGYEIAPHIELVAEKLEQVERYVATQGREGIGRLMIELAPRHGKSEQVSRLFPSWVLGRNPDWRIILSSYGASLAEGHSGVCKKYVESDRYAKVFGRDSRLEEVVLVDNEKRSVKAWDLNAPHRGGLLAVGMGGSLIGKGGNIFIIDDIYKSHKEAWNERYRQEVLAWYLGIANSRLEPYAAIILVMQRWHEGDLNGKLMATMAENEDADQFEIVSLPALALKADEYAEDEKEHRKYLAGGLFVPLSDVLGRKPGEALWPGRYSRRELLKKKLNLSLNDGSRFWDAQYQQNPKPMEGDMFGTEGWKVIKREDVPDGMVWFRVWDVALSEKKTADYTASVAVAVDDYGEIYMRDMVRGKWKPDKAKKKYVMVSDEIDGYDTIWYVESVAFQAMFAQDLQAMPELAGRPIYEIYPEGDKVIRALPLQGRYDAGKVNLVEGAWVKGFIDEAVGFPHGRHDDQVDSASYGVRLAVEHWRPDEDDEIVEYYDPVEISSL